MQVRSVMTGNVVTVTEEDRAWTAAELLARLDLTGLPVVDAERRVLGVVTDLDLIRALRAGGDLRATAVGALRPWHGGPCSWNRKRDRDGRGADGRMAGAPPAGVRRRPRRGRDLARDVLRAMMLARMQT
ncbi:MAG: CBS domain-containing protein [Dehalococcoidia bacterium]